MDSWFPVLCYDIECPHATVTGERVSPDTSQCGEEGYFLFILQESSM